MILRVVRGVRRRLLGEPLPGPYRAYLFEELVAYLGGRRLYPERPTLLDLPSLQTSDSAWLERLDTSRIDYVFANLRYSAAATTRRRQLRGPTVSKVSAFRRGEAEVSPELQHHASTLGAGHRVRIEVGLEYFVRGQWHRRVSRGLALARAAYLGTRPLAPQPAVYYALVGSDGYGLEKAL